MQRWKIISLGFQHEFFFVYLFLFSFKNAHFPWGAWFLWEKSQIDRWNLHRDVFVLRQRWEIISSGFQNEIFCFIRVWKMVYQQFENAFSTSFFFFVYLFLFSFENAHFSLRSLILVKKITHVDRRNLHRNVFVLRQRWEIIFFQNEFFVLFVFEKWFISNLRMHIRKKRPTKI